MQGMTLNTLKMKKKNANITVRRVLKDNKVPGTSVGTRVAKALAQAQGLLQDSWERARLSSVSSQVLVWTRGA